MDKGQGGTPTSPGSTSGGYRLPDHPEDPWLPTRLLVLGGEQCEDGQGRLEVEGPEELDAILRDDLPGDGPRGKEAVQVSWSGCRTVSRGGVVPGRITKRLRQNDLHQ